MSIAVKSYYYTVSAIEHFAREMYDDGYAVWKAYLCIVVCEMMCIENFILFYHLKTGAEIELFYSDFFIIVEVAVLGAINYFLIFPEDRWRKYQPEYNRLSLSSKLSILAAFVILTGLAVGTFMYFA